MGRLKERSFVGCFDQEFRRDPKCMEASLVLATESRAKRDERRDDKTSGKMNGPSLESSHRVMKLAEVPCEYPLQHPIVEKSETINYRMLPSVAINELRQAAS